LIHFPPRSRVTSTAAEAAGVTSTAAEAAGMADADVGRAVEAHIKGAA